MRVQLSPVPAHTIFGFDGSIATAPIDCTGCWSKTGLNVVPVSTDFQTPPLADPTITVTRPLSSTAVTAAMRPLIVADPMLRADSPEIVPESKRARPALIVPGGRATTADAGAGGQSVPDWLAPGDGNAKSLSGMSALASIRCQAILARDAGSRFGPDSIEKGKYTPLTCL